VTFRSSILGGINLIRAAIRSPNYAPGVSGWSINQDGSAEFNNITIRGGTVVGGTALYYSGTPAAGNLVASISATSGTDPYGNAYVAGVASYAPGGLLAVMNAATVVLQDNAGRQVALNASSSSGTGLRLTPVAGVGETWVSATLDVDFSPSPDTPYVLLQSPGEQSNFAYSSLELKGSTKTDLTTSAEIDATNITLFGHVTSPYVAKFGGIWTPLPPAYMTSDQQFTSTTTLTNVTQMFIPVEANATYKLEGFLEYTGETFALGPGDLKLDMSIPAGATLRWSHLGAVVNSANAMDSVVMAAGTVRPLGTYGTSTDLAAVVSGRLTTGANSGFLQLKAAQNTACATPTTLRAGSWLTLSRIL